MNPLLRRKILRITSAVIVLPLLVAGGAYGYYWYQIRSVVEDFARQLSPFATLSYSKIEAGLDGVAGVSGLQLIPEGQKEGVTVDRVLFRASDPLELMQLHWGIEKGQLPQRLGVDIQGMRLAADSPVLLQYQEMLPQQQHQSDWMLGCEQAMGTLTPTQVMQRLGYQQLELDLSISYWFDNVDKQLQVDLHTGMADGYEMDLGIVLDLKINQFDQHNLQFAQPWISDIQLDYQDKSLNGRQNRFCAEGLGVEVEAYVDSHIELLLQRYRLFGLEPGPALVAGYRQFLLGKGQLQLELLSGKQLGGPSLLGITPELLLEQLAPKLWIDGQPIEPLEVAWVSPEQGEASIEEEVRTRVEALNELLQSPFIEEADEPETPPAPEVEQFSSYTPPSGGYQTVAMERLPGFIGSQIRIRTQNGFLLQGRLLSVGDDELRIYREVGTGDATLPIAFRHIEQVLVYR
ncbi:hypothetical protein DV711_12045 [Motiliproteus coralliicola]|uniref:Uncharacterized protein n=1 Tax=Motiliproteus coralliicola TaxID=2283196 RepID=A0A369WC64_9GAMM|nr:hypothetical protein [Motiliproteus coralliicola]RDE19608.1 hypothetical protein DV711_12045 [Motiliproteus coralliicola]